MLCYIQQSFEVYKVNKFFLFCFCITCIFFYSAVIVTQFPRSVFFDTSQPVEVSDISSIILSTSFSECQYLDMNCCAFISWDMDSPIKLSQH